MIPDRTRGAPPGPGRGDPAGARRTGWGAENGPGGGARVIDRFGLVRAGAVCNDLARNIRGASVSKADDAFIRQFIIILVVLAAYGVGAGILGVWIAGSAQDAAAASERATLERIAPVGRLKVREAGQRARAEAEAAAAAAAVASDSKTAAAPAENPAPDATGDASTVQVAAAAAPVDEVGEAIYKQYCFACHMTAVAQAPKTGDTEAWAPRAAQGFDALYKTVLSGKGAMPARAGFPHLSDEELKAGIRYLLAVANVTAE